MEYQKLSSPLLGKAVVLIVEDDLLIAQDIKELVEKFGCRNIEMASTIEEALQVLAQTKVDLVLLDIHLNSKDNGTSIGRLLNEELNIPFIYITAYADSASIEQVKLTKPSGYLLKPFSEKMLFVLIEIALAKVEKKDIELDMTDQTEVVNERAGGFLHIRQNGIVNRVAVGEIIYLVSDRVYVEVHTKSRKFVVRKSLMYLSAQLSNFNFIKCHKKYIVNLNYVQGFNGNMLFLDGLQIPVGRTMKELVKNALNT